MVLLALDRLETPSPDCWLDYVQRLSHSASESDRLEVVFGGCLPGGMHKAGQGVFRRSKSQAPPALPPPPPNQSNHHGKTKFTIVGPFLVHKLLGPKRTPPRPPTAQKRRPGAGGRVLTYIYKPHLMRFQPPLSYLFTWPHNPPHALQAFTAIMKGRMTEEELRIWFMRIDANANGSVDWDEFSTYLLLEGQQTKSQETARTEYIPHVSPVTSRDVAHSDMVTRVLVHPRTGKYYTFSRCPCRLHKRRCRLSLTVCLGGGGADPRNNQHNPQCANCWALLMRKRHRKERRPQRPSESIDPRSTRREGRVTVQGPVKKPQPDEMSHRGRGGCY